MVECLAEHPAGLRLGATHRIGQQEDAIDHFHDTLHLSAKVGVAWGVNDVDGIDFTVLRIGPFYGEVLRFNSNALFTFQIHRVHGALLHLLVFTVGATLLQQAVHESGLAVVNVCDDGDITDVFGVHDVSVRCPLNRKPAAKSPAGW